MFTGLIQKVGRLERIVAEGGGARLSVAHDPWPTPIKPGESVAVHGICLTVTRSEPDRFECDLLAETLERTNLGTKAPGALLNLERPLQAGDPLGGHFVTGHVDGTGVLLARRSVGRDWEFEIGCSPELVSGLVLKGSVACDGVSLTVARLGSQSFTAYLIPYTLEHTAFGSLKAGEKINIEADILGKHVLRYLGATLPQRSLTVEQLRNAGLA